MHGLRPTSLATAGAADSGVLVFFFSWRNLGGREITVSCLCLVLLCRWNWNVGVGILAAFSAARAGLAAGCCWFFLYCHLGDVSLFHSGSLAWDWCLLSLGMAACGGREAPRSLQVPSGLLSSPRPRYLLPLCLVG